MVYKDLFRKDSRTGNPYSENIRSTTYLVQRLNEFQSEIWIEKDGRRINAKSLLGVLSLGIIPGNQIQFFVEGEDEQEVWKWLAETFGN